MCEGKSEEHRSYQIWTNDKQGTYKHAMTGDLPLGTKSVGFADMGALLERRGGDRKSVV